MENGSRKIFPIFVVLALLSACGGSGSGTTNIETLWQSPRQTGAGLVRATDGTSNSVALVLNTNDAGKYKKFEVVSIISETRNYDGSYTGEVVVRYADGSLANVIGRFYGTAARYGTSSGDYLNIVVGGDQSYNLPIGNYVYSGYADSYYIYNGNEYAEQGNFSLNVQFLNGAAQLNARTTEAQYINNNITITSTGEMRGTNGTFIVYATDGRTEIDRRNINFHGTFHGNGATHTSGMAVGGSTTNDDFSIMAIVGYR